MYSHYYLERGRNTIILKSSVSANYVTANYVIVWICPEKVWLLTVAKTGTKHNTYGKPVYQATVSIRVQFKKQVSEPERSGEDFRRVEKNDHERRGDGTLSEHAERYFHINERHVVACAQNNPTNMEPYADLEEPRVI